MKQSSSARKNRYLNEAFEKLKIFLFSKAKRVVSRTSPLMRGGLFYDLTQFLRPEEERN